MPWEVDAGGWSASVGYEDHASRGADVLGCSPVCNETDWPAGVMYRYVPREP